MGGLTRSQSRVLAALASAPLGLASFRSVARRAEVSPVTAQRALPMLIEHELATAKVTTIAAARARVVTLYQANVTSPQWSLISPLLVQMRPAKLGRTKPAKVVPYYLRHLFWNVAATQLDIGSSATFIARRLISVEDLDGLAWGTTHLPADAWEHAAHTRGLDPASRARAANLAHRIGLDLDFFIITLVLI